MKTQIDAWQLLACIKTAEIVIPDVFVLCKQLQFGYLYILMRSQQPLKLELPTKFMKCLLSWCENSQGVYEIYHNLLCFSLFYSFSKIKHSSDMLTSLICYIIPVCNMYQYLHLTLKSKWLYRTYDEIESSSRSYMEL